jgi:hypothetical protein
MKLAVALILLTHSIAFSQKQLVLVKGEKVLLRLHTGDEIVFKMRGASKKRISYINNLHDTALVAHRDVIPLHRIERLYFKQDKFLNLVGGMMVIGGVGFFLIDQINVVLVDHGPFGLEEKVALPSAVLVGVGLPLLLMKKKSQRLGGRYRLIVVEKGSPFYRPERTSSNYLYEPR